MQHWTSVCVCVCVMNLAVELPNRFQMKVEKLVAPYFPKTGEFETISDIFSG